MVEDFVIKMFPKKITDLNWWSEAAIPLLSSGLPHPALNTKWEKKKQRQHTKHIKTDIKPEVSSVSAYDHEAITNTIQKIKE